jgi:hypothetical protein
VDPVQPAGHPGAGLVEVGHRRGRQPRAHDLGEPVQSPRALGHHRGQGAGGHRRAEHVGQQLRGPVDRQVLVHAQVAHQRAHPRPVAGRRTDMVGEGGLGRRAAGAAATLGPMLGREQAQRWQVEHLAGLDPDHARPGQVRAAPAAPVGGMQGDLVGLGDPGQVRAGGAGLLPGPAPRGPLIVLAACPRGLAQPVRDGGLEESEESLPSRRSSSTTRACSVSTRRACSALTARSSAITAACTATVASRSGPGEGIEASRTTSGHARLPMGRTGTAIPHAPDRQLVRDAETAVDGALQSWRQRR